MPNVSLRTLEWAALLWLLPALAAAQGTIVGSVTGTSGEPLPGVNVLLAGTTQGAATNVEGQYRITNVPAGAYVLAASAVGFERAEREVTVAPGETVTVDFRINELTIRSGEVVVTAGRRAQLEQRVPVSLSVVAPRDLEARNIVALDDALRYVPGVQVQENQVNVRGSSGFSYNVGSRVLLLLDGLPLLTPDSDGFPFDALPFSQIERIEVVKGPGSALYGGGALGGVVNVITKDAPETPETSVRAFAGAYQPARYEVWYETWPEGDAYRPFFGTSITHARKVSPTLGGWVQLGYQRDDGYLNFNEFDLSQLYAKVDWRPQPTLKVGLLAGVLNRTKDTFLFWNGSRDALQPGNVVLAGSRDGPPSGTTDNNTLQLSLWPTLTHVLAPDLFYSVRLRAFAALIRPISDETGEVRRFADGTVGVRYGGEWQLDWAPKASRQLTFGVSGDALLTRSSLFRTGDDDEQGSQPEGAVFAQWDEQVTERIAVVAGLRFDGYAIDASDTVTRLSPKLSGSYVLNEAVTLRAGFGQGFRVPSLAERFADDRSFFPIVRNPDLQPERSSSVEAGVRATLPFGGGAGLQTDVALFWNDYWDLIEPAIKPEASAFQFVNLTRARIRGVEIGLDAFTPTGDRTLRLGYTLMRSDDLTLGQELSFRPRHLLKAGIDGQLVGPFRAGADYRFASRPRRVDSDFVRFVPNADVLVAQHFVDFRLSVDWSRLRVTAHARNAFDYYALERPAFLGAPRHYEVQMQWDF